MKAKNVMNSVLLLAGLVTSQLATAGLALTTVSPGLDVFAGIEMTSETNDLGGATQAGTMELISGNVSGTSAVNQLVVTGNNPLQGDLFNIDDGIALQTIIAGSDGDYTDFLFDVFFDLTNNSLSDYLVSFVFNYDMQLTVNSVDGFIESEIFMEDDDLNELFAADGVVDSYQGNEFNGVLNGNVGGSENYSGLINFDVLVAAGDTFSMSGFWDVVAEDFDVDGFSGDISASLLLSGVQAVNNPPNSVPEPAMWALFLIGLGVVARSRVLQQSGN